MDFRRWCSDLRVQKQIFFHLSVHAMRLKSFVILFRYLTKWRMKNDEWRMKAISHQLTFLQKSLQMSIKKKSDIFLCTMVMHVRYCQDLFMGQKRYSAYTQKVFSKIYHKKRLILFLLMGHFVWRESFLIFLCRFSQKMDLSSSTTL